MLDGLDEAKETGSGTAEKDLTRRLSSLCSLMSVLSRSTIPVVGGIGLIHFANAYRARQVYNNILHDNASLQAHFGRSGLNMLSYDPRHDEGMLYLFDDSGRASAKNQLLGDIPRLVTNARRAMSMMEFYENILQRHAGAC